MTEAVKIIKRNTIFILLFIVVVVVIIIYPHSQVSKPQFSSFCGNVEDFNLSGEDCIVEFNTENISFISKEFRINSVRNIIIESRGCPTIITTQH